MFMMKLQTWKERLSTLVQKYFLDDIWNQEKTVSLFCAIKERYFTDEKHSAQVAIMSSVQFLGSHGQCIRGKEIPMVIRRAALPRCFKGIMGGK